MASLYLGNVTSEKALCGIHAFTKGLPFKAFKTSEISDVELYDRMLNQRFKLLECGQPIYCTAINPDTRKRQEYNPHDDRLETVHIVALNENDGTIACSLSVAVDTGEKEHGALIGLPLENRWKRNNYPEGVSLDAFRNNYIRLNHNCDKCVEPHEMAELYRHFKTIGSSHISRLGVYTGAYHLLVREARNRGERETYLWVFAAIQDYFNLYRLAGAAVLRDFTIRNPPRFVSPNKNEVTYQKGDDGKIHAYRKGEAISRNGIVPKPFKENDALRFRNEEVPFLDGLVDIHKIENAVKMDPFQLGQVKHEGMFEEDMFALRMVLSFVGRRAFEDYHNSPQVDSVNNNLSDILGVSFRFNDIGK